MTSNPEEIKIVISLCQRTTSADKPAYVKSNFRPVRRSSDCDGLVERTGRRVKGEMKLTVEEEPRWRVLYFWAAGC
jgi:hypothetical protein